MSPIAEGGLTGKTGFVRSLKGCEQAENSNGMIKRGIVFVPLFLYNKE